MVSRPALRYAGWLLVLLAAWPGLDIVVENRLADWFPEEAEIMENRTQFIEDFGHDEWMFYYVQFPDDVHPTHRKELVAEATDSLWTIRGLDQVFSRDDIQAFDALDPFDENAYIDSVETMYFDAEEEGGEMFYLRQRLSENPDAERPGIVDSIYTQTAFLEDHADRHLTGSGVIYTEIDRITHEEAGVLLGTAAVVVLMLLALRTRSLRRTTMVTILAVLAYVPALSVFGWLGIAINMVTMVVPLLLLILVVVYLLHMTSHTEMELQDYLKTKIVPISLAGLTTILGIGSLVTSEFPIVQDFGYAAAVGLVIALIIILLLGIPQVRAMRQGLHADTDAFDRLLETALERYYRSLGRGRAAGLSLLSLGLAVAAIITFPRIEVDTNSIHFLNEENEVRQDVDRIEDRFGYFNPVDLMVSPRQGSWNEDRWKDLTELRHRLERIDVVDGVISFDLWHEAGQRTGGFEVNHEIRPQMVSDDDERTHLMARVPMGSAGEMEGYFERIMAEANRFGDEYGYEITPAGYMPIYLYQMNHIVEGMLQSLGLALLLILIVVFLAVRDWRLGLASIFPNLFPLLMIALIMYLTGVPLDISTSVIACVVIGIVVDDCLHILWYYRRGQDHDSRAGEIFAYKVLPLIRPLTSGTLIFGLGFLVLTASDLLTVFRTGLLCSLGLFVAWIADVVLFPAVLKVFNRATPPPLLTNRQLK